jgi:hypothetical protein
MTAITLKQIDSNIKRIATTGAKLNILIHETALAILVHAAPKDQGGEGHGDVSRAQTLVMAMPASMRRTELIRWFTDYSPIVVKNNEDWNSKMHKPETVAGAPNPLYRPFNIEAATANPFYERANANPEREPMAFEDMVKMVERLGKRIEKQLEDGLVKEGDEESAKAVVRTIAGLKLERITGEPREDIRVNNLTNDDDAGADNNEERAAA